MTFADQPSSSVFSLHKRSILLCTQKVNTPFLMNATDIREIVLKMNDQDVKQKVENLKKRLESAQRVKADLEKGLLPAFANKKVAVST